LVSAKPAAGTDIAQRRNHMQPIKVVTSNTVSHLKQKAKALKREKNISHLEALDAVAISAGFNHWHDVTQANERLKPAETSFMKGCVFAFDIKDGLDIDSDGGILIHDQFLELFCDKSLFKYFCQMCKEDDPDAFELDSEEDIREEFKECFDFMFFRLRDDLANKTVKECIALASKESFFSPHILWHNQVMVDTYNVPSFDEQGNLIAIRF